MRCLQKDWESIINNFPLEQDSIRISQSTSKFIDIDSIIINVPTTISNPFITDNYKNNTKVGIGGVNMMKFLKDNFKEYIFKEYENGDIEMEYCVILAWKKLEESKRKIK